MDCQLACLFYFFLWESRRSCALPWSLPRRSGLSQIDDLQLCCIILLATSLSFHVLPHCQSTHPLTMKLFPGGGRVNGPCQNVHLALFFLSPGFHLSLDLSRCFVRKCDQPLPHFSRKLRLGEKLLLTAHLLRCAANNNNNNIEVCLCPNPTGRKEKRTRLVIVSTSGSKKNFSSFTAKPVVCAYVRP